MTEKQFEIREILEVFALSNTHHGLMGEDQNAVDALFDIADAMREVAASIRRLGNADASTPMGAIEAFGNHMGEKMDALVSAIGEVSNGR